VPAHAHADPHPFKDLYEYNFMTLQEAQLGTVSYGDAASEQKHLHDMGPVIIPPPPNTDLCNKYKNSPNNLYGLYYLFYTQNQIGDFFPSNNDEPSDGDMIDNYGGWMSRVYSELGMDSNTRPRKIVDLDNNKNGYDGDGDLSRIRHYSYLYSIRSVAALYQLFEETVKDTASHGYKVTVTTGKVDGAGTDSDVYMKLIGTKGNTVPQLLDKPGYNDFEKGDSDVYTIVSPYDIGDISGVVITFSPKDAGPGWYLDNFVVEDIKGKKWTFPYMDWITIAGDYPLTAIGTTYSVAVRTGDVDNAGTDSDITINLVGDKGPTGPKYLDTPNYDDFERKAVNTFSFTAPSVGDIKYIIITASPKGSGPDWWLDFIVVTDTRTKKMWTFMWNKWIQSGGYSIPLYSTSGG
jgi:hypothetical protein